MVTTFIRNVCFYRFSFSTKSKKNVLRMKESRINVSYTQHLSTIYIEYIHTLFGFLLLCIWNKKIFFEREFMCWSHQIYYHFFVLLIIIWCLLTKIPISAYLVIQVKYKLNEALYFRLEKGVKYMTNWQILSNQILELGTITMNLVTVYYLQIKWSCSQLDNTFWINDKASITFWRNDIKT